MQETKLSDLTFLGRESVIARFFARPVKRFLAVESAGGVLLLIATAIALIWVNSPWGDSYDAFWNVPVNFSVNGVEIFEGHSLADFVNDAAMAVFFFVVGLEIKRELVDGQLQNARYAALPAFAALGGMIVPAAVFYVINAGGPGQDGWGIPMATDIAFAVGIVSLLGDRIPRRLKVFLLSLAIVDDIGAIIVIALFYSSGISTGWLIATVILLALIFALGRLRVWWIPIYVLLGTIVWWTTFRSGVHATIAGVALGLLTPARPLQSEEETRTIARWLRDKPEVFPVDVRYASFHIRESVSVAERLETAIHPITSYAIIPIFALANAGVRMMIAGIGFTVSLFVNNLAFGADDHHGDHGDETAAVVMVDEAAGEAPGELAFVEGDDHGDDHGSSEASAVEDNAKIGILFASVIASVGGLLILSGGGFEDDEDD